MPPRAKTTRKNASDVGKRHPLNMRTTAELRRRLEEASKASGVSLAQEVERRLDRSFAGEDVVTERLGGPEIRNIAVSTAATFAAAARSEAQHQGNLDWSAKDWLGDQACSRAGVRAALLSLVEALPDRSANELQELLEDLRLRLTSYLARPLSGPSKTSEK